MSVPTALVIDDSAAMRIILGGILRQLGFGDIAEAAQGSEALAMLRQSPPPALALVDWNMPVMNGLDFIRAVRADSRFAGMRLMVITSETGLGQMSEALACGADEYLMKPFNKESVAAKLLLLGLPVAADVTTDS